MATSVKEKMTERGDNDASTIASGKRSGASASCAGDHMTAPDASLKRLDNANDIVPAESIGVANDSELSSFATSSDCSFEQQPTEHWFRMPLGCSRGQSFVSSSGSGSDGDVDAESSECCGSTFCSMPESEAFWPDLPAMKPLINPSRLQALRLCSRDRRIHDISDSCTTRGNMTSPEFNDQQLQWKLDQRLESLTETLADSSQSHQTQRSRSGKEDETKMIDDSASEELQLAMSASYHREAIYQYSFRVPETKANMRPFCDPADRRVEAIARACDSEILLDPVPIRPIATSAIRLRRVTIRAPDKHSLEKCCGMFDEKFPHFYVSGGLGPGGRGVSKVFDDANEKFIAESQY